MQKINQTIYVSLILSIDEKWKPEAVTSGMWYEVVGEKSQTFHDSKGKEKEVILFGVLNDSLGLSWIPEYNCNAITKSRLVAARKAGIGSASPDSRYGLKVSGMTE